MCVYVWYDNFLLGILRIGVEVYGRFRVCVSTDKLLYCKSGCDWKYCIITAMCCGGENELIVV